MSTPIASVVSSDRSDLPIPIPQRLTRNIYSWRSIADPSKVVVYFAGGIAGAPDTRIYFMGAGIGKSIQSFLEVSPKTGYHARKRYWVEKLGAKKYP